MAVFAAGCFLLVFSCLFSWANSALTIHKPDHPVPTYFGRRHADGSLVDARDPANHLKFQFSESPQELDPVAALEVSPSVIENGGVLSVSWSGVSQPGENDTIVLYCPPDAQPEDYLDFYYAKDYPTYKTGSGSFQVRLWNMRKDCGWRYYSNNTYTRLAVESNRFTFRGGIYAPLQAHLALTNDPTQMRIMWVSGTNDTSLVLFGSDPSVPHVVEGHNIKTYNGSDMCELPATGPRFVNPGYIHDVLLTNLKPSSTYYYSCGSAKMMSPVRKFQSAPVSGSGSMYTAMVFGDHGLSPPPRADTTATLLTQEVLNGTAALVFHIGDISYARGFAYIWDQWSALVEPYASRVPYMVGIGNHEYDHENGGEKDPSGAAGEGFHPWWAPGYGTDSGGECGVPMFHRFHMPETGLALFWYSFDYGAIHYIMMSTEHNFTKGSRQYEWLEQDLQKVDRDKTPWVVIGGHRAMYTSQKVYADYVISLGMQQSFEDLLYKYKVDMAFWAHYHSYERTCAVYKNTCTPGAPVHIVVGSAGKELDTADYFHMNWSLYHENNYGYGRLTQANRSALLWQWVENASGLVKDSVWLTK